MHSKSYLPIFTTILLAALSGACRSQSMGYVGKAASALGAHANTLADTATLCELRKDPAECEHETFGPPVDGKPANVYATDHAIAKSLTTLADYGKALEKLAGVKSTVGDQFVADALAINSAAKWTDLGDSGPAAIKEGVKLIDRLLTSGLQRREFRENYDTIAATMDQLSEAYMDLARNELRLQCTIEKRLSEKLLDLATPSCESTCRSANDLLSSHARDLRARLKARRTAIRAAAAGLVVFFEAHRQLGRLLGGGKTDHELLTQIKRTSKSAGERADEQLRAVEATVCAVNPTTAAPIGAAERGEP
ncbi:hypothetical protein [Nannocystis sp.]|uniref:hypothetical protein n=1 Tax=Nannocystis sp. TaxID=1962667 RepID=UPI0024262CCB|nr:hypothetical protein [Nannocystis sp.]MBK7830037.1 hypothetical protein [Nannocystis sp.]MBK9752015.1 hypothetical protein [Nannocystis sp.]